MTRVQVLGGLAVVLAGLVVWQNWPAEAPPRPKATAPTVTGTEAPAPAAEPATLEALAAHPLFSPSRSAPVAAEAAAPPPAAPEPATEAAPPPVVAGPVLQGLVLTPAPGAAYLGDGATGPSHFLRPGQSALGLTLQSVEPGHATFKGPEGEVVLTLQTAPAAEALPAMPPVPDAPAPSTSTPGAPVQPAPAESGPSDPAATDPATDPAPPVLAPDAFAPVTGGN